MRHVNHHTIDKVMRLLQLYLWCNQKEEDGCFGTHTNSAQLILISMDTMLGSFVGDMMAVFDVDASGRRIGTWGWQQGKIMVALAPAKSQERTADLSQHRRK